MSLHTIFRLVRTEGREFLLIHQFRHHGVNLIRRQEYWGARSGGAKGSLMD